jgi:hypothetical protein
MIGKVCTSAAFVFLATLGALQATPVVLLPVFAGVTVGETTEAESIAAVAGTAPAATCITHAIWPRRYCAPPFRCREN